MKVDVLNTVLLSLVALVTALTPVLLAMINNKQARALANSEQTKKATIEAAARVEDVKRDLQVQSAASTKQMTEIAKVGIDTHTLVNSNMGVQLKLAAGFARRLADITKSSDDEKAASLAELAYDEHVKKQAVVDAGTKHPPAAG